MPKEVKDIKEFLEIARRKGVKSAIIKKSTARKVGAGSKTSLTKFKIRCSKHLYTLVVKDADKADKLRQSLPPTLEVKEISDKKAASKQK